MDEILMWIFWVLLVLWVIFFTISLILEAKIRREKLKLGRLETIQLLRKIEIALRDFILAYDDQEPEQLLGAYQEAEEALRLIEEAKG